MDEASALLLAPLAQVVLTLRAGSSSGGGGAEVNWTTASGLATTQLHVQEKHLLAACALTHVEQAFASKLSAACRTAAADPDATTAKWEGSSDWVRSEVQAHMARLLASAAKQILEGDAKPLNDVAGAPWVCQWALTDNFQRWVVANKLHGPARLWCAPLAASRIDDRPCMQVLTTAPRPSRPQVCTARGERTGRRAPGLIQWRRPGRRPCARRRGADSL